MPTYSYACKACENSFDVQQAITEKALTKCPKCGGELRKVFGQVGVTFKGSGFYRNDSGSAPKATNPSAAVCRFGVADRLNH